MRGSAFWLACLHGSRGIRGDLGRVSTFAFDADGGALTAVLPLAPRSNPRGKALLTARWAVGTLTMALGASDLSFGKVSHGTTNVTRYRRLGAYARKRWRGGACAIAGPKPARHVQLRPRRGGTAAVATWLGSGLLLDAGCWMLDAFDVLGWVRGMSVPARST